MHIRQWKALAGAAATGSIASWLGQCKPPKNARHSASGSKTARGSSSRGEPRNKSTGRSSSIVGASSHWTSTAHYIDTAARCISAKEPRSARRKPVPVDCGEDAFFLAMPDSVSCLLGVADGVGGWAEYGIDSALFAWDLMSNCKDMVSSPRRRSETAGTELKMDPKIILKKAFDNMIGSGSVSYGSGTACVASLDFATRRLEVANLGDSGVLVIRGDSLVLQSEEQHHEFNCPYQLLCPPPGHSAIGDSPMLADKYSIDVKDGDLVLLATDGFFDNVHKDDVIGLTAEMRKHNVEAADMADALVKYAHKKSLESEGTTPFSRMAYRHGFSYQGGKEDDITVVIGVIS